MKILIVMGEFFPGKKYRGPPVSIDNFCSLMKEHECYIVTHNHDLFEKKKLSGIRAGWNNRDNCKVLYLSDEEYRKVKFEQVIEEICPDLIYLQGIFQACVFPCLQLAKKHRLSVLLAPRGELCEGALSLKKWKKQPYLEAMKALGLVKNIHWQSTSDEETEAIEKLMKVERNHIHRLDNIPSIPQKEYLRKKKESGEGRFVFLSRIHPKKNLQFAISLFKEIEGKVQFDIYGPIEDEDYWKQCREEIKRLPKNVKVEYKGMIGHDMVHEVFSLYDAFLFPTLSENYGHVIVESLIVGTPVIISDQTPWNDVSEAGAGWAIPLTDKKKYVESVQTIVNTSETQAEQAISFAKKAMDLEKLHMQYAETIRNI